MNDLIKELLGPEIIFCGLRVLVFFAEFCSIMSLLMLDMVSLINGHQCWWLSRLKEWKICQWRLKMEMMQPLCAATSQARALQLSTVADHQQRTRGRPHFLSSTAGGCSTVCKNIIQMAFFKALAVCGCPLWTVPRSHSWTTKSRQVHQRLSSNSHIYNPLSSGEQWATDISKLHCFRLLWECPY